MNELKDIQINLLKLFIDICDELDITYYCVCGTALGAVKYGGYIPWDDDVDLGLLRPDYERFLSEGIKMLPEGIFLQNYRTDKEFPHVFSKLRDSRTTQLELDMQHLNINHGIYIDIFPIDGFPTSPLAQRIFGLRKKLFSWKLYCALQRGKSNKIRIRNSFFRALGYHKRTAYTLRKLECMYMKYLPEDSELWCNHGNWQRDKEYAQRAQYGKGTLTKFEGIDVVVPENYDAYLTQKYGDWRSDPPEEKRKSHHNIVVCDAKRSYKEYMK